MHAAILSRSRVSSSIRLERGSVLVPPRVERGHGCEPRLSHPIHSRLPSLRVRLVEHQEVVLGKRATCRMAVGACELQMVRRARMTEHEAVEAVVVLEAGQHTHPPVVAIEGQQDVEVVGGTRNAQDRVAHVVRLLRPGRGATGARRTKSRGCGGRTARGEHQGSRKRRDGRESWLPRIPRQPRAGHWRGCSDSTRSARRGVQTRRRTGPKCRPSQLNPASRGRRLAPPLARGLEDTSGPLFDGMDRERSARLMAALDEVNARWGHGALVPAATGLRRPWAIRFGHRSPRYTTRVEELPTASAQGNALGTVVDRHPGCLPNRNENPPRTAAGSCGQPLRAPTRRHHGRILARR